MGHDHRVIRTVVCKCCCSNTHSEQRAPIYVPVSFCSNLPEKIGAPRSWGLTSERNIHLPPGYPVLTKFLS
jgi:hypothetical protein